MSHNCARRSKHHQDSMRRALALPIALIVAAGSMPGAAFADEGGVSFWNESNNNYMIDVTSNVTVEAYDSRRPSTLELGHFRHRRKRNQYLVLSC